MNGWVMVIVDCLGKAVKCEHKMNGVGISTGSASVIVHSEGHDIMFSGLDVSGLVALESAARRARVEMEKEQGKQRRRECLDNAPLVGSIVEHVTSGTRFVVTRESIGSLPACLRRADGVQRDFAPGTFLLVQTADANGMVDAEEVSVCHVIPLTVSQEVTPLQIGCKAGSRKGAGGWYTG